MSDMARTHKYILIARLRYKIIHRYAFCKDLSELTRRAFSVSKIHPYINLRLIIKSNQYKNYANLKIQPGISHSEVG